MPLDTLRSGPEKSATRRTPAAAREAQVRAPSRRRAPGTDIARDVLRAVTMKDTSLTAEANRGKARAVPRSPKTPAAAPKTRGAAPGRKKAPRAKQAVARPEEDHEVEAASDVEGDEDAEDADDHEDAEARDSEPAAVAIEVVGGHAEVRSSALSRPISTSIERLDPMAAYLREVQRHPLLAPEQTRELALKFIETRDPGIAAHLVTANLRLVVKIAYEYRRACRNIMDLVQEGNIGLMQAVKRYDPYRGVKLSSYAALWIRAYILRFIINNWRLVKLGTTQAQRKLFFNLHKKRAELQAMGIDPTHAEVAKRLNVPEIDVAEMDARLAQSERSLDAPVGDADGRAISKVDMMPGVGLGPEALMADEELQALLKQKLAEFRKTLGGRDKEVAIFDLRLVADEPLTLQELGGRFGVSRERVRQVEQRLLLRLRDYLKREMGDATESL